MRSPSDSVHKVVARWFAYHCSEVAIVVSIHTGLTLGNGCSQTHSIDLPSGIKRLLLKKAVLVSGPRRQSFQVVEVNQSGQLGIRVGAKVQMERQRGVSTSGYVASITNSCASALRPHAFTHIDCSGPALHRVISLATCPNSAALSGLRFLCLCVDRYMTTDIFF
jgi:hypothetical protein